jgi:hypothetical protein
MANGYDRQEAARAALNAESAEKSAMGSLQVEPWEKVPDAFPPLEPAAVPPEAQGAQDQMKTMGEAQELKPSDVEADYVPQPGITPEPEEDDIERQYFRRNMQPFADTALSQMSTDELMQGRGRLALTMAAAGSGTDPIDATQEKANNALLERIDQELRMRGRAF